MKNQVKVTANKEGVVFTPNAEVSKKDGKLYGWFRVEELNPRVSLEGVGKVTSPRAALITMLADDFKKIAHIYTAGHIIDGQVVIDEKTEKIGDAEQKTAGEGGEGLTFNGQPIYRYSRFTANQDATDTLLLSDRAKAANAAKALVSAGSGME